MKIKKILPVIGIAIFIYLLIKMDLSQVFNEILNIRINPFIIAVILAMIAIFAQTLKWFVIAKTQKISVPFKEAVKIHLIGSFYGFITPAKVGNILKANYLKKYSEGRIGKGIGNFVLDKLLDLCSLGLLVVIASFFFKEIVQIGILLPLLLLGSFILCLAIVMSDKLSKKVIWLLKKLIGGIIPEKLKEKIKEGFYSFQEDRPKKKFLFIFFLLNFLSWCSLYLTTYFIGISVGINVPFYYYLMILPAATLIAQLPITISGIGTREITLIGLFGLLGVEATKVFSMSLIGLALGDIIPAIFGFIFSLKRQE